MNSYSSFRPVGRWLVLAIGVTLTGPVPLRAYPPAPDHHIYGLVRNELGEPLNVPDARIIFEATNGVQVSASISFGLEPGVNYRLDVAMDSGIAPDNYKPTALRPTLPFRIVVRLGDLTYLPIEMVGAYAHLGEPAATTRIDLTLGEDADNDGLPDAWERLLLSQLGGGTLEDIRPGDDSDGDGISNLDEYLAGTFAYDPEGGFRLSVVPRADASPLLEFTVIKPRTYTVLASTDATTWTPVPFRIPDDGPQGTEHLNYLAADVRILRVEPALPPELQAESCLFKVLTR